MRRTLIALTGLVLALAASASAGPRAPAPATPVTVTATTFVASGRGWGHGVGMSQYGALGFANDGWTYDRILAHFYAGAELGPFPVAPVRVLVAERRASVRVRSQAAFRVRDVFGKTYPLPAGEVLLGPELRLTLNGNPTELAGPLVFLPGKAPLELDRPYRGRLEVGVAARKLNAVNVIGLEQYLAGVVAQEMPSSWPEEALKAQAVAARSYALARRVTGKGFDLYADVRSQVYGGIRGEHSRTTAAIAATKGQVLLWEGRPIDALFHSTSGGATADAVEVFGKAVPYLVAAEDPHSALSPVHQWGPVTVPETALRKGLKLRAPVTGLKLARSVSGRVATAQVLTASGATTISGTTLRVAGGLRSTWITSLASLSLTRPGGPTVYGRVASIVGKAQGVKGAVLQRWVGGAWTPVGSGLAARVRLLEPSRFRIVAGALTGPVLQVPVAPLVTAKAAGPGTVTGAVRPPAPGRTVELQVESGQGWRTTAARTTTGPDGAFTLSLPEAGLYRARLAPFAGFAEGLSGPVELR